MKINYAHGDEGPDVVNQLVNEYATEYNGRTLLD